MARFVCLFSYTPQTWQKMQASPGDRPAAIGAVVDRLGGTVVSMHYMLGPYDGIVVTDLPDTAAAAAMSTVAATTGAFAQLQTYALLAPEEMPGMLELSRTAGAGFPAPGA